MKKVLLALSFFAFISASHAQDRTPHNAIKLNPLSLFLATGNVSYEKAVTRNQSFQIGGFYSGVGIGDIKYSGFGITPEYRFYFGGKREALNGIYAAPFVRYQKFTLKDKSTTDKASFSSFGGGAIVGWERAYNSGFVLDIFAGPAYNSGKVKDNTSQGQFNVSSSINGFGARAGIALGFAF